MTDNVDNNNIEKEVVSGVLDTKDLNVQADAPVATPEETNNLLDSLPTELRTKINNKGFKSVEDIAKSYFNAESRLSKRVEDLTPTEVETLNIKLGRPEDISAYEFDPNILNDRSDLKEFADKAFEIGLNKSDAEKLFEHFKESGEASAKKSEEDKINILKEHNEFLKEEFGSAFDKRINLAKNAIREFGGEGVEQLLADNNLSSHPELVKMFSEIGKTISEGGVVEGDSSGVFGMTPREAGQKKQRLLNDKAFWQRFRDPSAPGHLEAQQELSDLYAIEAGSKNKPMG